MIGLPAFSVLSWILLLAAGAGTTSRITNCTENTEACHVGCNESPNLPYSATFCDRDSGSCLCDCRDVPGATCMSDPDSDCNLFCESRNPNPDVFTYYGSYCPDGYGNQTLVCSCTCAANPDYYETNEI